MRERRRSRPLRTAPARRSTSFTLHSLGRRAYSGRVAFEFDPKALQEAAEVSREHFAVPSFDGLSDAVFDHDGNTLVLIGGSQLHRAYLDALLDLHLLVEEYRFSALLALALLVDYTVKRD